MTDSQSEFDLEEQAETYPFPILSWLAVIAVIALIINPSLFFPKPAKAENGQDEKKPAPAAEPLAAETMVVKLYWGMQIVANTDPKALMDQLTKAISEKDSRQKLAISLVEALVIGPQEALTRLDSMAEQVKGTPLEKSFNTASGWIGRLKTDPKASIEEAPREELASRVGWFASIPGNEPAPVKDPKFWLDQPDTFYGGMVRYALRTSALMLLGFCAFLVGIGMFLYFLMLASRGPLGPGLASLAEGQALSAMMMQTFAIWFVGYFALSFLFGAVIIPRVGMNGLLAGIMIQVLSLAAAFWPLVRGVPLRVMLEQIGLDRDVGSPREIVIGILAVIAYWPVLLFLAIVTVVLMQGFPEVEKPTHPIGPQLLHGSRADWILAFITAVILAPIVEEVFFRGFLYRHLHETSFGAGHGAAVILSVGLSSLMFAIVHPQGVLGLPLLGGLGALFGFLRQTRDNLTASIAAHSFNNCLVILLVSFV